MRRRRWRRCKINLLSIKFYFQCNSRNNRTVSIWNFQENNDAFQSDDFSRKSFDQRLQEIIDIIESNMKYTRNHLTLDVNNLIANGEYGDIINGKINTKTCQVHVISGTYTVKKLFNIEQIRDWGTFVFLVLFSYTKFFLNYGFVQSASTVNSFELHSPLYFISFYWYHNFI